jgi:hypothetical protein
MFKDKLEVEVMRLLAMERDMLLGGRYGDLATLGMRKDRLFNSRGFATLGRKQLDQIRTAVLRNQGLLAAAREGIADAAVRLDLMRQSQSGFRSYDREGERQTLSGARPTLERRV